MNRNDYEMETYSDNKVLSIILGMLIEGVIILSCNLWFGSKLGKWYEIVEGLELAGQTIIILFYGSIVGYGIKLFYTRIVEALFDRFDLSNTYKNIGVYISLIIGFILFRIQTGIATLPLLAYILCLLLGTHYGVINNEMENFVGRILSNKIFFSTIAILGWLGFLLLRVLDDAQTLDQLFSFVGVIFMYSLILLIFEFIYNIHINLIYLAGTILVMALIERFHYHETLFNSFVYGVCFCIPNAQVVFSLLILRAMAGPNRTYYTDYQGRTGYIDTYDISETTKLGWINHPNGNTTEFEIKEDRKNRNKKRIHFFN